MKELKKKQNGITLIALVISIIVMLILAGVSLNLTIGDNGIVTQAKNAKIAYEEAELWEEIQMVLADATARDLSGEDFCDFCNSEFNSKNLKAIIKTSGNDYVLTYGKYNRETKITDDSLRVQTIIASVEGNSEDWNYEILSDGTMKLLEYKRAKTGSITIPNIIDGYLVTELGNNLFRNSSEITEIVFSNGLKKIGDYAFANCSGIANTVTFPSTLKEMGDYAFYNCTEINGSLDNIIAQKAKLGKNAFKNCKNLSGDINALLATLIDENTKKIESGAFSGFSGATGKLIIPAQIEEIEENAFYGCSKISGIEFESGSKLTKIGKSAFYECYGMTGALILPNSVTSVGDSAFYNCKSLNSLSLSSSLTSIGTECFKLCQGIAGELEFPATLNNSGVGSFDECDALSSIKFASRTNNFSFDGASFEYCDNLTTISLPSNVSITIDRYSFFNCPKLATISNFYKVTGIIGAGAFRNCTKLNVSSWSTEITQVGSESFYCCYSLTTLPDRTSLLKIGDVAFLGANKIEDNIINYLQNSKIESIGYGSFQSCTKLTGNFTGTITANLSEKTDKTIKIGSGAFLDTGVVMAKLLDFTGKTTIGNEEYANATVLVDNNNEEITEVTIPNTITSIGDNAFAGTNITKIVIPDSVTSIGSGCFWQCSKLTTVELSKNVKTIPVNCFRECSSLTCFNKTESSNINLNTISTINNWAFAYSGIGGYLDLSSVKGVLGNASFYTCRNLTGVKFGNELTSIGSMTFAENFYMTGDLVIPDSVVGEIPHDATFYKCDFTSVTIGSGVTSLCNRMFLENKNLKTVVVRGNLSHIGDRCFIDCNSLESITMDWNSMESIGAQAFRYTTNLTGTVNLPYNCTYNIENTFQDCGLTVTQDYVEGDT